MKCERNHKVQQEGNCLRQIGTYVRFVTVLRLLLFGNQRTRNVRERRKTPIAHNLQLRHLPPSARFKDIRGGKKLHAYKDDIICFLLLTFTTIRKFSYWRNDIQQVYKDIQIFVNDFLTWGHNILSYKTKKNLFFVLPNNKFIKLIFLLSPGKLRSFNTLFCNCE